MRRCRGAAGPARDPQPARAADADRRSAIDVEDLDWSADGATIAVVSRSGRRTSPVGEIHLVDVATGEERRVAGGGKEWAAGPRAMPGGGFLYLSDADGWFQVVRLAADGRERRPS